MNNNTAYTTVIAPAVGHAWRYYSSLKGGAKNSPEQIKKNQAFLSFCSACGRDGKSVESVVKEFTRH